MTQQYLGMPEVVFSGQHLQHEASNCGDLSETLTYSHSNKINRTMQQITRSVVMGLLTFPLGGRQEGHRMLPRDWSHSSHLPQMQKPLLLKMCEVDEVGVRWYSFPMLSKLVYSPSWAAQILCVPSASFSSSLQYTRPGKLNQNKHVIKILIPFSCRPFSSQQ